MYNPKLDVKLFPFFNSVAVPLKGVDVSESFHNSGYRSMIIEFSGDITSITAAIEGCVNILDENGAVLDDDDCAWVTLCSENISSTQNTKINSISAKGIYKVDITGLSRIRINVSALSGKAKIVGVMSI